MEHFTSLLRLTLFEIIYCSFSIFEQMNHLLVRHLNIQCAVSRHLQHKTKQLEKCHTRKFVTYSKFAFFPTTYLAGIPSCYTYSEQSILFYFHLLLSQIHDNRLLLSMNIGAVSSDARWIATSVVAEATLESWLDFTLELQMSSQIVSIRVTPTATLLRASKFVFCR